MEKITTHSNWAERWPRGALNYVHITYNIVKLENRTGAA
jgi:hypothetical protein